MPDDIRGITDEIRKRIAERQARQVFEMQDGRMVKTGEVSTPANTYQEWMQKNSQALERWAEGGKPELTVKTCWDIHWERIQAECAEYHRERHILRRLWRWLVYLVAIAKCEMKK